MFSTLLSATIWYGLIILGMIAMWIMVKGD
jgi:hypothetical protein